jgi:hypothetical protein
MHVSKQSQQRPGPQTPKPNLQQKLKRAIMLAKEQISQEAASPLPSEHDQHALIEIEQIVL